MEYECILTNAHRTLMIQILYYVEHHIGDRNHKKTVLGHIDAEQNFRQLDMFSRIEEFLYMYYPEEEVILEYEDQTIRIGFMVQEGVYETSKNVYEKIVHMSLRSEEDPGPFMTECVRFTNERLNGQNTDRHIMIYFFDSLNEYWEKTRNRAIRKIDTIFLPDDKQYEILEDVRRFRYEEKEVYEKFGIPYHKTYCFYGPPGSGKTSLIFSIASEMGMNIAILNIDRKMMDATVIRALNILPENTMLVLEDVDCLFQQRQSENNLTFSGFLNMIDGISVTDGLIIFMTTNHIQHLDPALKRPGRIDYAYRFDTMKKKEILKMLRRFFPEQEEDHPKFYEYVKKYTFTNCVMQKYMF
ncbi:AAA family ATPase, partial [bacterium]|nr:AAA family ATPase [bacterium]